MLPESFLIIFRQVLILFVLTGIGVIAGKAKMINEKTAHSITNIVLYFVTPAIIIQSFYRVVGKVQIKGIFIVVAFALFVNIISIIFSKIFANDKDEEHEKIYKFSIIFSNCGFMALPLEEALLGEVGVFYGAIYLGVFNIFVWTYGLFLMSCGKEKFSLYKIIFNPGIVAVFIGIILIMTKIGIPGVIVSSISYLAALNTPIPMIIIGYYVSLLSFSSFKDLKQYKIITIRLIILPLITLLVLWLFHIDEAIAIVCVIGAGTPVAAITTMFATKYGGETMLSARIVSLSTLMSLFTLPIFVMLVKQIL